MKCQGKNMAIPITRQEFAQFCLRKLGAPVLKINVSEEQVDDIIDQALYHWNQYHYDGSELIYYAYQLTTQDIENKAITLPENFIGVTNIFPIGQAISTNSMFNMRYQFVLNDLYNLANVSIVPYFMVMTHLSLLEEMLVGQKPIRYNRHNNIVYLDMDMTDICAGMFIILITYSAIDPSVYPDAWKDKWLQDYTVALIRRQWGQNLSLYGPMAMPGGMKLDGPAIFNQGNSDMLRMEEKIIVDSGLPPMPFIA